MINVEDFSHVVTIDEDARKLVIYRVFENGKKSLYTSVEIPENLDENSAGTFARTLGENLLVDAPAARRLLG
jgi:hypothetical protein